MTNDFRRVLKNIMNITNEQLDKIKEILSRYDIYQEYFHHVATIDCDFKVFANKEVECLYYLFVDIFDKFPKERFGKFELKGKFINIDHIDSYKKEMSGKRILLVADFITDIDEIRKDIQALKNISPKVTTWCLLCDADKVKDTDKDVEDTFGHVIYSATRFIREPVQRVSDTLNYLNIRMNYNGIKIATDRDIKSLLGKNVYCLKKDYRIPNYDSSKLFVSFYDKDNILKENGITFFIRFYQNIDGVTIIPELIIPNIDQENIVSYCQNLLSKFNLPIKSNNPDQCYKDTINQLKYFLLEDYLRNAQSKDHINIEDKYSNFDIKSYIYRKMRNNDNYVDLHSLIKEIAQNPAIDEQDVILQLIMLLDENKILLKDKDISYGTKIKKTAIFYRLIYELCPNTTCFFYYSDGDRGFLEYCARYMLEYFKDPEYLNFYINLSDDQQELINDCVSLPYDYFIDKLNVDFDRLKMYMKLIYKKYEDDLGQTRELKNSTLF